MQDSSQSREGRFIPCQRENEGICGDTGRHEGLLGGLNFILDHPNFPKVICRRKAGRDLQGRRQEREMSRETPEEHGPTRKARWVCCSSLGLSRVFFVFVFVLLVIAEFSSS